VVFCYVDLGLVSGRVTVFLGVAMGVLAVLHQLKDEPAAHYQSEAPNAPVRRHLYS
jgi:hypothetical protein